MQVGLHNFFLDEEKNGEISELAPYMLLVPLISLTHILCCPSFQAVAMKSM